MYTSKKHVNTLTIPRGMNRLNTHESNAITGGKRRKNSLFDRVIVGVIGGLIVPGGFLIAFL